ncbi:MAG: hypothetical protein WCF67_06050 [Chitinophagaceae bacterium]
MKKSASLLSLIFISLLSYSQNITGSWYGRADVDMEGLHNNYLTELVLKQKGDEVEGVFGYYFKNMYQSVFIRGRYDQRTRRVSIKNLPLVHFRSSMNSRIDCPMDFEGTLMVSKAKSTLQGFFLRQEKYKHTCPDVRVNYTLDGNELNQDSILKNTVAGQKVWSPLPEDIVYADKNTTVNSNPATTQIAAPDTNSRQNLITRYEARKNIFQKEITVSKDSLRISFYDNGDIDGDSISVFMNGQPVLARMELDVRGLNLYIKLDSTKEVNEITMFAENLGKIPPNTALMIVYDGEERNEVYLSSSLTQNAVVRIRRKK